MELRISDYYPENWPARTHKCANGYCYVTPAWVVRYIHSADDTNGTEYVCNNHLVDFITSRVNNMRIRKQ